MQKERTTKKIMMSIENSHKYWEKLSNKIKNAGDTSNKRNSKSAIVDVEFIKSYLKKTDKIIDIGSGSGLVVNHLVDCVSNITAVETFVGLTTFIDPNILVINAELIGFKIRKQFDVAISTGVSQYFNEKNINNIYSNIFDMLKENGILILRNHCGLTETVEINGFSEELQTDYFTEYRQIENEINLLKNIGFKSVDIFDSVSEDLNVWENTRHFYFVCKK